MNIKGASPQSLSNFLENLPSQTNPLFPGLFIGHEICFRVEKVNVHRTSLKACTTILLKRINNNISKPTEIDGKSTKYFNVSYFALPQVSDNIEENNGVIGGIGLPLSLMTPSHPNSSSPLFLRLGFDSEWQNDGGARRMLTFQFSFRTKESVYGYLVLLPQNTRFSLSTVLSWFLTDTKALTGFNFSDTKPFNIYLIGHYSIVDITGFFGRDKMIRCVDSLRRTVASVEKPLFINVWDEQRNHKRRVNVHLRDTYLLSPAGSSLASLGESLGMQKLDLPEGYSKDNMLKLLQERPIDFILYAVRDSEITEEWVNMCYPMQKIPTTLGSEAARIVRETICRHRKWSIDEFDFNWRGLSHEYQTVETAKGLKKKKVRTVRPDTLQLLSSATEAYYGGRNETFLFGPAIAGGPWLDFDLKGAYPCAMSLIPDPDLTVPPTSLGAGRLAPGLIKPWSYFFAYIRFQFPAGTLYPSIPVKDKLGRGLIYPISGEVSVGSVKSPPSGK